VRCKTQRNSFCDINIRVITFDVLSTFLLHRNDVCPVNGWFTTRLVFQDPIKLLLCTQTSCRSKIKQGVPVTTHKDHFPIAQTVSPMTLVFWSRV